MVAYSLVRRNGRAQRQKRQCSEKVLSRKIRIGDSTPARSTHVAFLWRYFSGDEAFGKQPHAFRLCPEKYALEAKTASIDSR